MDLNEPEHSPPSAETAVVTLPPDEDGRPLRVFIDPPQSPDTVWTARLMDGAEAPILEVTGWICAFTAEQEGSLPVRSHLRILEAFCAPDRIGRGYAPRLLAAVEEHFAMPVEPTGTGASLDQQEHWEWLDDHHGALQADRLLE